MKVKCRGYEGELIELSATTESKLLSGEYKILTYGIRMAINRAMITMENVKDEEIEFIKE